MTDAAFEGSSFERFVGRIKGHFGGWTDQVKSQARPTKKSSIDPDEFSASQLASWLPYSSWKEDDEIFINVDSIGFVVEVSPQTGADGDMAQILSALYAHNPDATGVQVSLLASPRISHTARAYGARRIADKRDEGYSSTYGRPERNANPYRAMVRRRVDYLKKAAREPLAPTVGSLVRVYRCIISYVVPGNVDNLALIKELKMMRIGMRSTLRAAGFPSRQWNPDDLINWNADLLNPQRMFEDGVWIEYDEYKDIRDQIIDRDTHTSIRPDKIVFWKESLAEHVALRNYAVKTYPRVFALWQMSGLIGDLFQGALQYGCPFMITMGVYFKNRDAVTNEAQLRQARATQNAESKMAKYMPQMQQQKQDWDLALKAIDRGETLVDMYHSLALFATNDTLQREEQVARSIWASKGFDINLTERVQLPGLLSHVPMALSTDFYKDLESFKLTSTKLSSNAVHLAPLMGEWSGTETPTMILAGRRGQITTFDFFDNKAGNFNVAVAGASGSGKSVFVNDVASSYASIGGRVWIIDIGRSYENLCESFNGDFIEFTPEKDIKLNPFTFVVDIKEEMELLQPLIAQMMSPKKDLDNLSYANLAPAIMRVWNEKGNQATITDLYELLKTGRIDADENTQADQRIRDLATLLFNYTRDGAYGRYFEGDANIRFDNFFTVLELEELNSKKDLRAVILFIMMYRITYDMYLSPRDQRKLVILDEAWDLLGTVSGDQGVESSASAKFIDAGYRRARKYGGAFVTATQNITDYDLSPAAQSALKNSDWRCYLRQKAEALEVIKGKGIYADDPGFLRALQGLRTEEGVFSEVLVSGPGVKAVMRCYIDPYTLLQFSSKAEDFTALRSRKQRGMTLDEATEDVLRTRNAAWK